MKERQIDQDVPDPLVASRDNPAGAEFDARPPSETESTTRHIFLMQEGDYRCSRCGAPMNDRTLDQECPAAKSG